MLGRKDGFPLRSGRSFVFKTSPDRCSFAGDFILERDLLGCVHATQALLVESDVLVLKVFICVDVCALDRASLFPLACSFLGAALASLYFSLALLSVKFVPGCFHPIQGGFGLAEFFFEVVGFDPVNCDLYLFFLRLYTSPGAVSGRGSL